MASSSSPTPFNTTALSPEPGRRRLLNINELMGRGAPAWLVKGVIPQECLGMIVARPGQGKTFLATDIALSVAHGLPVLGRRVLPGLSVIVAGEGVAGLSQRVAGWHIANEIDPAHAPAYVLPGPLDLMDTQAVVAFINEVQGISRKCGAPVRIVFIDTLARCSGGGDENLQRDMGRLIANCDLIRTTLGCAVILIHHQSKDSDGPRGSTVLPGACDSILAIRKTDAGMEVEISKQKDGQDGLTFGCALTPVQTGVDDEGDIITTLVCSFVPGLEGVARATNENLGKNQQGLLDLLRAAGDAGLPQDEWEEAARLSGLVGGAKPKRAFREALDALTAKGLVEVRDGLHVAVTPKR